MKVKTNSQLKKIAIAALKAEFGFSPKTQSEITILAYESDGTYILFDVCGKTYRFKSYAYGGITAPLVWTGAGTIARI